MNLEYTEYLHSVNQYGVFTWGALAIIDIPRTLLFEYLSALAIIEMPRALLFEYYKPEGPVLFGREL